MFFNVILSIWTLLHVYVGWRGPSIPIVARYVPRPAFLAALVLLWASYLLSRIANRFGLSRVAICLEFIGVYWVGILFLTFLALLAADLVTGFGLLMPRLAPSVRNWSVGAALVLCAIAIIQAHRAPVVTRYDVALPNLPAERDGAVLVLISDTHLGTMLDERWIAARIAQVKALHPDLIVLAGDNVEDHGAAKRKWGPILGRLSAPLGVWAVDGNHETFGRRGEHDTVLEDAGIHLLHDRWEQAAPGLIIAGVDDLTTRRRRGVDYTPFLNRALAGRPSGDATILVSHTPWPPNQTAYPGIGLMLSGHTHNGQIWPLNYVVKAIYPFVAGNYDVNGMRLIVCRGTGTWGPRMRLWQRGEIVRIVLHAAMN
jgi:predicted MPP superfamily phosphohydrolase